MRPAPLLLSVSLAVLAPPAWAQDHSMHHMPAQDMSGHDMPGMEGMAMEHGEASGTDLPAGNAPPPPLPAGRYADRQFPPEVMERAHHAMMRESGGQQFAAVQFNLAEYQPQQGRDGYRWDAEAWLGGDIDRLTIKSEGAGMFGRRVEDAEVEALYSRAIDPYFNLQAGIRQDLGTGPRRTYAALGIEGLAPYWFEIEAAAYLSNKGDVLARLQGYYDQRLTQRLVLQPRAELQLAAQDIPESRIGAGLSSAELGLRLRYEVTRKFAPYIGVTRAAKIGQTARYARSDGEDPATTQVVLGLRAWL